MNGARAFAVIAIVFALGIAASYGLAQLGEPQSVWLWSLLGLL
jgi:hypothetical protein